MAESLSEYRRLVMTEPIQTAHRLADAEARAEQLEAALTEVRGMAQNITGCKVSPTVLSALSNVIEECRTALEKKGKDVQ